VGRNPAPGYGPAIAPSGSGDLVDVLIAGVLRWCGSDRLEQARVRLAVVGGDLADDQTHSPFVAEVEEVRDSLTLLKLEPTETDPGAPRRRRASEGAEGPRLGGVERMGVLARGARPELAVQPERVEVVILRRLTDTLLHFKRRYWPSFMPNATYQALSSRSTHLRVTYGTSRMNGGSRAPRSWCSGYSRWVRSPRASTKFR
jgi:hypothetical protein